MKKFLCITLAIILCLGCLCACGGAEPSVADQNTPAPTPTAEPMNDESVSVDESITDEEVCDHWGENWIWDASQSSGDTLYFALRCMMCEEVYDTKTVALTPASSTGGNTFPLSSYDYHTSFSAALADYSPDFTAEFCIGSSLFTSILYQGQEVGRVFYSSEKETDGYLLYPLTEDHPGQPVGNIAVVHYLDCDAPDGILESALTALDLGFTDADFSGIKTTITDSYEQTDVGGTLLESNGALISKSAIANQMYWCGSYCISPA